MVNSPNNASHSGNGEAKDSNPSSIYENLDPGLWAKTDAETGESEIVFNQQLPEEIRPDDALIDTKRATLPKSSRIFSIN